MYFAAEHFHFSGVLAVVSGGLFLSGRRLSMLNYMSRIRYTYSINVLCIAAKKSNYELRYYSIEKSKKTNAFRMKIKSEGSWRYRKASIEFKTLKNKTGNK